MFLPLFFDWFLLQFIRFELTMNKVTWYVFFCRYFFIPYIEGPYFASVASYTSYRVLVSRHILQMEAFWFDIFCTLHCYSVKFEKFSIKKLGGRFGFLGASLGFLGVSLGYSRVSLDWVLRNTFWLLRGRFGLLKINSARHNQFNLT